MHSVVGDRHAFYFNSDLSGDVLAVNKETGEGTRLLGQDLIHLAARWVRSERIATIEDMTDEELLFGERAGE